MFLLIKIGFTNVTQIDPQALLKISFTSVTRNRPTSATRNKPTNVTRIDPQTLHELTHKRYSK